MMAKSVRGKFVVTFKQAREYITQKFPNHCRASYTATAAAHPGFPKPVITSYVGNRTIRYFVASEVISYRRDLEEAEFVALRGGEA